MLAILHDVPHHGIKHYLQRLLRGVLSPSFWSCHPVSRLAKVQLKHHGSLMFSTQRQVIIMHTLCSNRRSNLRLPRTVTALRLSSYKALLWPWVEFEGVRHAMVPETKKRAHDNGKRSAYRNHFPASLSKYWSLETLHAEDAAHSLHPFDLRGLQLIQTYKLIEGNRYHSQTSESSKLSQGNNRKYCFQRIHLII